MRVLILSHTAELGGAEIALESMARGLTARGFEVHVALGSDGPLVGLLRRTGTPVHRVAMGSVSGVRRRSSSIVAVPAAVRLPRSTIDLGRLLAKTGVDALLTNTQKAHVLGSAAAVAARVPVVWRMHDVVSPDTFGAPQRFALRVAAAIAHPKVAAVSNAVAVAFRNNVATSDVRVIYNGVDPTRLVATTTIDIRSLCGWSAETLIVGTLGRLVRWKGLHTLVDAAAYVAARDRRIRFVLVGAPAAEDSSYLDDLKSQIQANRLDEIVRILPFQEDVAATLASMNVLAQPSIEPDPFPYSVLEALHCGVPVIAFSHGGVTEMVVHGVNGLLVNVGDVHGLGDAILRMLRSPGERDRLAAASQVSVARFTAVRMCALIGDLLVEAAHGGAVTRRATE